MAENKGNMVSGDDLIHDLHAASEFLTYFAYGINPDIDKGKAFEVIYEMLCLDLTPEIGVEYGARVRLTTKTGSRSKH